jgi:thiamine pyrophosphate-dependent acetolactate synthase large subunit-like protein
VHGKPGLESAAAIVQEAQLVLTFGVHNDVSLLANLAGLQVRECIQFEPDVSAILPNARFNTLLSVVGDTALNITKILARLENLVTEPVMSPRGLRTSTREEVEDELEEITKAWSADLTLGHNYFDTTPHGFYQPGQMPSQRTAEDKLAIWKMVQELDLEGLLVDKKWDHITRFEVEGTNHEFTHPAHVMREMSRHLTENDVLCVDTGDVTLWAALCAVLTRGTRTLSSECLGTMGYSLCAGFVASLVRGDTGRAVVVAGDGGIQMTIGELGTVCQQYAHSETEHKLLLIILDNEKLGRVAFGFAGAQGCELGPSPDFVALAKAYGGDGTTLRHRAQLESAMAYAFSSTGLFVLHVLTDPTVKADMTNFKDNSIKMMNSG